MQEERIRQGISDAIEVFMPEGIYEKVSRKIKRRKIVRYFSVAGAACVFLFLCIAAGFYYNNFRVDSIVDIDVNPSIELKISKNNTIVGITGVNADGANVIIGEEFQSANMQEVISVVIDRMIEKGYLYNSSAILVSIQNSDTGRVQVLKEMILTDIEASLEKNRVTASVINQTVPDDEAVKQFSLKNSISTGKAAFVLKLAEKDPSLDSEQLAQMEVRDIVITAMKKKIELRDVIEYDSDDAIWADINHTIADIDQDKLIVSYIGKERAIAIAAAHAGESVDACTDFQCKIISEGDENQYTIQFQSVTAEYHYVIDAITGNVLSHDKKLFPSTPEPVATMAPSEPVSTPYTPVFTPTFSPNDPSFWCGQIEDPSKLISEQDAKAIALKQAGITSDDYIVEKCERNYNNTVYEVEIYFDAIQYQYEIDAKTGKILAEKISDQAS